MKTVNFDDPATYQLYYGNYNAKPGSSITFSPWQHVSNGAPNTGEVTIADYAIPKGSNAYWKQWFDEIDLEYKDSLSLFEFKLISLQDNGGWRFPLLFTMGGSLPVIIKKIHSLKYV